MATMMTRTEYSFKRLLELQRVASKIFAPKQTLRKKAFYLVWGSCCLGMGAFMLSHGYNVFLGLLMLIPGLFLMLRYIFYYHLLAWGAGRNMKAEQRVNEFYFEEKYILARQGANSAKYQYAKCYRLLETDNSIFFILEDGQGLMLDKLHLSGGSVNELRSYLEHKTGKTVSKVTE